VTLRLLSRRGAQFWLSCSALIAAALSRCFRQEQLVNAQRDQQTAVPMQNPHARGIGLDSLRHLPALALDHMQATARWLRSGHPCRSEGGPTLSATPHVKWRQATARGRLKN
jgi:hypothetical protein